VEIQASEKFEKIFVWGVRWAGHVGSYPRTLDTPQQSSFFKSSAPNAAVALVFPVQRWKRRNSG